jgi:hypothetical protein
VGEGKTVSAKPAAILPAGHLAHQVGWEKAPPSFGAALSFGRWIAVQVGLREQAGGRAGVIKQGGEQMPC